MATETQRGEFEQYSRLDREEDLRWLLIPVHKTYSAWLEAYQSQDRKPVFQSQFPYDLSSCIASKGDEDPGQSNKGRYDSNDSGLL